MADYNFKEIEPKWQAYWEEKKLHQPENTSDKPKYYVLDMFPYPSGAGLHVGHPLGYIASDIVARYKRLKGYNVLHPMGFDSFGLPAEQYAIQTNQHPQITTEQNIARYKEQLKKIGLSYDWSREVRTSDPSYYKWTQWIFGKLFNAWYNKASNKAEPIQTLIEVFQKEGNKNIQAVCDADTPSFSAMEWENFSEKEKSDLLLKYRLTYLADAYVNWCPALGTVLANDEVKNGLSERGGHPVERKRMRQWMMRITAYAERLLHDLETIDWSESIKEVQRNWIGKSIGAEVQFKIQGTEEFITVFTTRVDTIFGVTYLALAPEHELLQHIVPASHQQEVKQYMKLASNRSERDRQMEANSPSGIFTGAYVVHPFTKEAVPIWVADYVLAGYGTGAVMGVPSSDERDYRFAQYFKLPIVRVIEGSEALMNPTEIKTGNMINSGFLNGLHTQEAIAKAIAALEKTAEGKAQINYKLRDAVFSRQRYWGEPVPIYFKDGIPELLKQEELPLQLPAIDKYLPTETGEPPLGRAQDWKHEGQYDYELSTMPGWAGSSWYWLRYMDPSNENEFVSRQVEGYWKNVDLYIGGAEHGTGHLLYSRFWNKVLYDLGLVSESEPFKKLINQGMIQGRSNFVYRIKGTDQFVSYNLRKQYDTLPMHVDVNMVYNDELDLEAFKNWRHDLANAEFILEEGKYICGAEVEKMSKRWHNVINPDDVIAKYGADTLRLYEMFLGPLEQFKPWNTQGIDGTFRFLRKLWRLFHNQQGEVNISEETPNPQELKTLHQAIKRVTEDIERYSFNTPVSHFMICVNELTDLKCNKRSILEPLLILLAPYVPHTAEELWHLSGHQQSVHRNQWPVFEEKYIQESTFNYPVSINGKVRTNLSFALDTPKTEMENSVMADEVVQKWLEGKPPKKVIIVDKKIINVVV